MIQCAGPLSSRENAKLVPYHLFTVVKEAVMGER